LRKQPVCGGFFGDLVHESFLEGFCIEDRDRLILRNGLHFALQLVFIMSSVYVAGVGIIGWRGWLIKPLLEVIDKIPALEVPHHSLSHLALGKVQVFLEE
jgi:hypothetical protein